MELKDRICAAMSASGMTQADLCRATKMGSSKISQILKGKVADPRLSTVVKIADALDVPLDYLAGRDASPPVPVYTDPRQRRMNDAYERMGELMKDAASNSVVSMLGAENARGVAQTYRKTVPEVRVAESA